MADRIPGIHIDSSVDIIRDIAEPGAFQFMTEDRQPIKDPGVLPDGAKLCLAFYGPDGGGLVFIPIVKNEANPIAGWQWDGNVYGPTISPSIKCRGAVNWHGHLVKGEWIPCQDS